MAWCMKVEFSSTFIKAARKLSGKMLESLKRTILEAKAAEDIKQITDCKKLVGYSIIPPRSLYQKPIHKIRVRQKASPSVFPENQSVLSVLSVFKSPSHHALISIPVFSENYPCYPCSKTKHHALTSISVFSENYPCYP